MRKLSSLCRKLSRISPFDTWAVARKYPFGHKRYFVYRRSQGSSDFVEVDRFLNINDVATFLQEQFC